MTTYFSCPYPSCLRIVGPSKKCSSRTVNWLHSERCRNRGLWHCEYLQHIGYVLLFHSSMSTSKLNDRLFIRYLDIRQVYISHVSHSEESGHVDRYMGDSGAPGRSAWTLGASYRPSIQIAFDIYIAALTFLNSAHRPRPLSVKLITDLQRDGGMFFFVSYQTMMSSLSLTATIWQALARE